MGFIADVTQTTAATADSDPIFGSGVHHSFFATPWYGFINILRVVDILVVGLFVGRVIVGYIKGWMPKYWRRMSWIGISSMMLALAETEIAKIGYPVGTWGRLWFVTFGVWVTTFAGAKFVNRNQVSHPNAMAEEPLTIREAWGDNFMNKLHHILPYRDYDDKGEHEGGST
jgi:hypothetical protein